MRRHGQPPAARLVERPWLDRFSGLLAAAASVLDLGCGSGVPIGRYFVDRAYAVTGVDSAPDVIGLFRANLPGQDAIVADSRHNAALPPPAEIPDARSAAGGRGRGECEHEHP